MGRGINYPYPSLKTKADEVVSQIPLPLSLISTVAPRAVAVQADVTDEAQVKALFNTAEQTFKTQPHIVVTSAGVIDSDHSLISDIEAAEFDRIFSVNTKGTFLCIKEAANKVIHAGGGRIVTLSSSVVGSLKGKYGAYAASKAVVETMTKILAKELRGSGITVNGVAPGPIAMEMFLKGKTEEMVMKVVEDCDCPLERLGEVEDVAPVVGFLVSDAAEWVNGQIIRVNGGYV